MADIKAIQILTKELNKIRSIPRPPTDYSQSTQYKKDTEKVISECVDTMKTVSQYAERINATIDEVRAALKEQTRNIQTAIKKTLDNIKPGNGTVPSRVLEYVRELQQVGKAMLRLEEFMLETENVFVKVQNNVGVTMEDIDTLKGYLKSWQLEKDENYEEEQRRLKEEQKRREEEERKRREEEERRRKEEEERRKREEEERRRKEEEERERKRQEELRRLEEERLRKEEEERRKREEEERLRLEEEERIRREEEERKRKLEEERRRRAEEEAKRRELERKRREEEKRKREKKEKEEAERRWRLDPNNWNNTIYNRTDDQVDGNRSYHNNVCCILCTPPAPPNQTKESKPDLECLASDEVDDIIQVLGDGEKAASSIVNIESKGGEVALEAPVRAFMPHSSITDPGDELVIKASVNGSDWVTCTPFLPTQSLTAAHGSKLVGLELDKFENAKLVVVARRKSQTIIVDKPGISQHSNYDKNIKIFVPRDAVPGPTELRLSIKPITEEALTNIRKDNQECEQASAVSSLIMLNCERPFSKDIEIDLINSGERSSRNRSYHLYRTSENAWKFADAEFKGRNQDVSVSLPASKVKYCLMQMDLPTSTSKEAGPNIAETIYDYTNKTVVRMVLRQKSGNPAMGIVHCVKREMLASRLDELVNLGYTIGADVSKEFYLNEGQTISITCSGNIDIPTGEDGKICFPFFAYMDTAKANIVFHVKDKYKQRDLPEYIGKVICTVHQSCGGREKGSMTVMTLELPVTLPKVERQRAFVRTAALRFPYYLSSLANFLALKLTEHSDVEWYNVLEKLDNKKTLQTLFRRAKGKVTDENDEKALCRAVLQDWMKATERQRDKIDPILKVLEQAGLRDLKNDCKDFILYQRECLTDGTMATIAQQLKGDPKEVGAVLGLDEKVVTKIIRDNEGDVSDQMEALLLEWRHSDAAVKVGTRALDHLKELLHI